MSARERRPVIVGGGPAGAAAAALLARAGLDPLLIERSREPRHTICGEFLSVEAQSYLRALGVDALALGGAPIRTVRIASGEALVETPLPFLGVGLTRRNLDEALLQAAAREGAGLRRGEVAREILARNGALAVKLRGGEELAATTIFLATGKHDLHAPRRPPAANDLVGFKCYYRLAPAQADELAGAVEIALFAGGYAGLQLVENGMANLCLLVARPSFEAAEKRWEVLLERLFALSPHLRRRLDGACPLLDKPLSIAHIPYGFLFRPDRRDPPGLFRLGDQMGVIPSFSGDGMAIALHSAHAGVDALLAGGDAAPLYHRRMRADVGPPIRLAGWVHAASRRRLPREALVAALRLFPGLAARLAAWTRIPAPRLGA